MKWIKENKLVSFVIASTLGLVALRYADEAKYHEFIDIAWDSFLFIMKSAKEVWKDLTK